MTHCRIASRPHLSLKGAKVKWYVEDGVGVREELGFGPRARIMSVGGDALQDSQPSASQPIKGQSVAASEG